MNYFELYHIPVSLDIDQRHLRKTFFKLSKQYHPDRFIQGSEEEQTIALEQSSLINEAYETLKSFDKTLAYILTLTNKLGKGKEIMDNMFLFEMMDINESIDHLERNFDQLKFDDIKNTLEQKTTLFKKNIDSIILLDQIDLEDNNALEKLKTFYLKMKYILRIKEKILTFAIQ